MDKKILILLGLAIFALGFYFGNETAEDYQLPKEIMIRRDGVPQAYAKTRPEDAVIVNLPNVKDPGAYLAFPIYSDKNSFERLMQ